MSAKEKAKELVDKYYPLASSYVDDRHKVAKECALIAVDEIIKEIKSIEFNHDIDIQGVVDYYDEVKKEIDLL